MKKKRILIIIAISALSLIGLVVLQINWILHAAQLRESQLKHRITLASYRISYRLSKDTSTLRNIGAALEFNHGKILRIPIQQNQQINIDSLLRTEFRYHQISLPYKFEIFDKKCNNYFSVCMSKPASEKAGRIENAICMESMLPSNQKAELRITFFNKNQYVFSQMNWMLTGSFVLIALVFACFAMTIQIIWRQKKISEMTSDFINNMTHELKTPISTIGLASNMLRKEQILENKQKLIHYSGIITEENHKLQCQVEQVLRIARLEKGEFKLNKCLTNIHDIIQDAINTVDLQVKTRGGQIKCYLNALQENIEADATHLTNVISNLLDNANKYSPESPEIIVSTHDKEDGIVIAVEDSGIGMSKDKQKYIYEKFYRVSTGNVHDVKGFGLGLAYVKMMVDAHKGQIHLQSELGKGSKFEIFLPYY
jgi:two-component system, OmpR family, phosphate regulon sensor histidine kinase PhoR